MNWNFAYTIGFHPWEDTDQAFSQSLASLIEREEQCREPPYGRALDIGTGSAIWGIELAKRGWEVTGVDYVRKAALRVYGDTWRETIPSARTWRRATLRWRYSPVRTPMYPRAGMQRPAYRPGNMQWSTSTATCVSPPIARHSAHGSRN